MQESKDNTTINPPENEVDATIPTRVSRELDQTVPTRVQPTPSQEVPGMEQGYLEAQPVRMPVDEPGYAVTQAVNLSAGMDENPEPEPQPETPVQSEVTQRMSVPSDTIRMSAVPPATASVPPGGSVPPAPKKAGRARRWPFVVLGIFLVILFAGLGVWMGYNSAIDLRKGQWEQKKVTTATEHFMLGLEAQNNKQWDIARTQFEYVIQLDPTFPGATDKLREVMAASMIQNTPTPAPTVELPTPTPTRDTRPMEDIFTTAKQQMAEKKWDDLFATIDSLRTLDPTYRAVEVDGMLYTALRFRGVEKIIYKANLEGGIYDLALAEQFGPLDQDAIGYRNWARMYLNGASFWEVDWIKVMNYFEQIYPSMSNMRDSSGMTAIDRYRIAAREQGRKMAAQGDNCGALEYFEKSLNTVPDGELAVEATKTYEQCYPPTPTATVTPVVTNTPSDIVPPAQTVQPQPTTGDSEPPAGETPQADPTELVGEPQQ